MSQSMSDNDYLEQYIAGIKFAFDHLEDIALVKDSEFNFRYVSPAFMDMLNFDEVVHKKDVLNQFSHEVKKNSRPQEMIEGFIQHDELVRDSRKGQKAIYIDKFDHILLVHKRPIINPATDNFVGVFGTMNSLFLPNVLKLIFQINKIDYGMLNDNTGISFEYELTERQHLVLFFYLHRYSAADIASILTTLNQKLSLSRVNDHLENLKYIFKVKSKEQLIEKALALNYNLFIPRELLKMGVYPLSDEIIISAFK